MGWVLCTLPSDAVDPRHQAGGGFEHSLLKGRGMGGEGRGEEHSFQSDSAA